MYDCTCTSICTLFSFINSSVYFQLLDFFEHEQEYFDSLNEFLKFNFRRARKALFAEIISFVLTYFNDSNVTELSLYGRMFP